MKRSRRDNADDAAGADAEGGAKDKAASDQNPATRRVIRSEFLKLKTLINGK